MSAVSLARVRLFVQTSLSDSELQQVIDHVENMLAERAGAVQNSENTVELTEIGYVSARHEIFTAQPIAAVLSIAVGSTLVDAETIGLVNFRSGYIPLSGQYFTSNQFSISYKPQYRPALYESVVVDLIRLELAKTPMLSESIGGEYSYQAPNWAVEYRKIMLRWVLREF